MKIRILFILLISACMVSFGVTKLRKNELRKDDKVKSVATSKTSGFVSEEL
jgi:hypothetical protein